VLHGDAGGVDGIVIRRGATFFQSEFSLRAKDKTLRIPLPLKADYDAYVNGPALGATMRGRVNFKTQTVNLGGTYVPLYGLNSALGAIPILGGIFVGRQGEGLVGITFAIQGQLDDPNVLVNPISVVAPGIFRQIFEFREQGQNAAASAPASAPSDFGAAAGR